MPDTNWLLVNASVVLAANVHNPSIINPDFLKDNKIVEDNWELATPSITTLAVAQIHYRQNVSWMVTPNQCIISEDANPISSNPVSLYRCAEKYTEVLKHIPYASIGLNWHVILTLPEKSNDWMKSKLLKRGKWQNEISSVGINIKMESDDSSVFSLGMNNVNNNTENVIPIDCNFHFNLKNAKNKTKRIATILDKQSNYQKIFFNYLKKNFIQEKAR